MLLLKLDAATDGRHDVEPCELLDDETLYKLRLQSEMRDVSAR